jgi:hypothetical protein
LGLRLFPSAITVTQKIYALEGDSSQCQQKTKSRSSPEAATSRA